MYKRPNPADRMRDSFYIGIINVIEKAIRAADNAAKAEGIQLSDSNVKSALAKAKKLLKGGELAPPESGGRNQIIYDLATSIAALPDYLGEQRVNDSGQEEEAPLAPIEVLRGIATVESSLKKWRSKTPGSRTYIHFIRRFLQDADRAERDDAIT